MPQTIEAIHHAKAAQVPIIVAINKIDRPDAKPQRIRQELLQHGLVPEELGGEVQTVEVSAKEKTNLDKLEESVLLQAEILELKANPDRPGTGTVIEARLERGRGAVATLLVQRGTIRVGDTFVAGTEWGRVRALVTDRGESVNEAGPSSPIEVLGLQGAPLPGEQFVVVENENRARQITEFRHQKQREAQAKISARSSVEQMFSKIAAGESKELAILVKSDVQGSLEAITGSLTKLSGEEVAVRVLHAAVGGINESDITLARASNAMIIGFNVRANPQAREMARRDGVDIRYYSIIYNVIDDISAALKGMTTPSTALRTATARLPGRPFERSASSTPALGLEALGAAPAYRGSRTRWHCWWNSICRSISRSSLVSGARSRRPQRSSRSSITAGRRIVPGRCCRVSDATAWKLPALRRRRSHADC